MPETNIPLEAVLKLAIDQAGGDQVRGFLESYTVKLKEGEESVGRTNTMLRDMATHVGQLGEHLRNLGGLVGIAGAGAVAQQFMAASGAGAGVAMAEGHLTGGSQVYGAYAQSLLGVQGATGVAYTQLEEGLRTVAQMAGGNLSPQGAARFGALIAGASLASGMSPQAISNVLGSFMESTGLTQGYGSGQGLDATTGLMAGVTQALSSFQGTQVGGMLPTVAGLYEQQALRSGPGGPGEGPAQTAGFVNALAESNPLFRNSRTVEGAIEGGNAYLLSGLTNPMVRFAEARAGVSVNEAIEGGPGALEKMANGIYDQFGNSQVAREYLRSNFSPATAKMMEEVHAHPGLMREAHRKALEAAIAPNMGAYNADIHNSMAAHTPEAELSKLGAGALSSLMNVIGPVNNAIGPVPTMLGILGVGGLAGKLSSRGLSALRDILGTSFGDTAAGSAIGGAVGDAALGTASAIGGTAGDAVLGGASVLGDGLAALGATPIGLPLAAEAAILSFTKSGREGVAGFMRNPLGLIAGEELGVSPAQARSGANAGRISAVQSAMTEAKKKYGGSWLSHVKEMEEHVRAWGSIEATAEGNVQVPGHAGKALQLLHGALGVASVPHVVGELEKRFGPEWYGMHHGHSQAQIEGFVGKRLHGAGRQTLDEEIGQLRKYQELGPEGYWQQKFGESVGKFTEAVEKFLHTGSSGHKSAAYEGGASAHNAAYDPMTGALAAAPGAVYAAWLHGGAHATGTAGASLASYQTGGGAHLASWNEVLHKYSGGGYGASWVHRLAGEHPGGGAHPHDRAIVEADAKKYGVPFDVLWGVYGAESSFGKAPSSFGLTGQYGASGTSGNFNTDARVAAQDLQHLMRQMGDHMRKVDQTLKQVHTHLKRTRTMAS